MSSSCSSSSTTSVQCCKPRITSSLPSDAVPTSLFSSSSTCSQQRTSSRRRDTCQSTTSVDESYSFTALITPVTGLGSLYNGQNVTFTMRRVGSIVTLQWDAFIGVVAGTGIANLQVQQSIYNLPTRPIMGSYVIEYAGVSKLSIIEINPMETSPIKFWIDQSRRNDNTPSAGFTVYGGSITWMI